MMGTFDGIREMIADILDIDDQEIMPETYIVRDLGAESIDLLELAVSLNSRFNVEVYDGEIFLTRLREYITEAEDKAKDVVEHLVDMLPFLVEDRVEEIIADLEGGPTLKVRDLVSYIEWQLNKS